MLERLRQQVCEANLLLPAYGLVTFTWGNVSAIDRDAGLVVIKPSGVNYQGMCPEDMVIVDMQGAVIEGGYKPSSDLATHLELYHSFQSVGGIVHTHSRWATAFAQAERAVPCYGTTHADYYHGAVPCTRMLTESEIAQSYERNTGRVIAETFENLDPLAVPAVVACKHGPFTWGVDAKKAVESAVVLEEISHMAFITEQLSPGVPFAPEALLDKHYRRKHGPGAYYGQ